MPAKPTPPLDSKVLKVFLQTWSLTTLAILILASLIWAGFYLYNPDYPLNAQETSFVVFCSVLVVLLAQKIWRALTAARKKP